MNHDLGTRFESLILSATGATRMEVAEEIQNLWSGYGKILRIRLTNADTPTVVVKHVRTPTAAAHPRGWNSDLSHQRKIKSYQIETHWYRDWNQRCDESCRTPRALATDHHDHQFFLVLEDLDAAGYPSRLTRVSPGQLEACLQWLANFHATFMQESPTGLWQTGTYWHLETRPDEWAKLDDLPLKSAAQAIDRHLNRARYRSLVHGDAKLANFCFSKSTDRVAAVDFQYVGGGCGMKDLAYFIGSCLDERSCEQQESQLLDRYFSTLRTALKRRGSTLDGDALEAEWRELYPLAWTDFHRFLKGWSPDHWKINTYSERLARKVVNHLGQSGLPATKAPFPPPSTDRQT